MPTTTTTSATPTTTSGGQGSANSNASVDAVTDDGAVLVLDDGSVYSVDSGDQSTVSSWSQGDSVAVDDAQDAITNLSTGENVSVTYVANTSDNNAWPGTTGSDNSIAAKSDDGSIIVLDDGSIWAVDSADQPTSAPWVDATSITVNQGSDGSYQLVDTDDQETVSANYIGQE